MLKYVTKIDNKYVAMINITPPRKPSDHGTTLSAGSYDTEIEAHNAAVEALKLLSDYNTFDDKEAALKLFRQIRTGKICNICHKKLDAKWNFCPYCGEKILAKRKDTAQS